jgi:demethylmenaquinone methyltransferase/2-methoxy-6-polyprenyl-1,4-benzoquinol methylase
VDFARAMLERAEKKLPRNKAILLEADALHLPVASDSVHLLTVAFGFRNLANYTAGLREIHRVLRPGGEVGILDFSEPDGLAGKLYQLYFRRVLPRIGALLSGSSSAYAYLPQSVHRFPPPQEMARMMRQCGFENVSWKPYTLGIAGLYRGVKR